MIERVNFFRIASELPIFIQCVLTKMCPYLSVSDAKVKRPRCRACLQISAKNKPWMKKDKHFKGEEVTFMLKIDSWKQIDISFVNR